MQSLHCVLGLPQSLPPAGHAGNTSPRRHTNQIPEPPRLGPFDAQMSSMQFPLTDNCVIFIN